MIGKITKGSAFKGCVQYVLDKDNARLLDSEGVLAESAQTITKSFYMQYLLKPDIKCPVGHISLSYSKNDASVLTDSKMIALAKEYMHQMGIVNTQHIIVRHEDREHPHVHIVFNRIDNDGKTISDKNDRYRNRKICKELKLKYGLYFAEGKENVKFDRLRDHDRVKYEIFYAIKDIMKTARNWPELQKELKNRQIELKYKYKGQTDIIQGVSFIKDNTTFKGSEIDRSFSFSNLERQLVGNRNQPVQKQRFVLQREEPTQKLDSLIDFGTGFFGFPFNSPESEEYDPNKLKKKKKRGLKL
jgi:Relaxase/Mobilisation nuclease domain.